MPKKVIQTWPKSKSSRLTLEELEFLKSNLERVISFTEHLDTHIAILIGFTSSIFIFSLTQITNQAFSSIYQTLAIFSATATIIAILAVRPPSLLRKQGQIESLLYRKKMISFDSADQLAKLLPRIIEDKAYGYREFARETYNMIRYYYRPKKYFFYLARTIFMIGVLVAVVMLVVYLFQ
ncbi:MAG: hypothetical protein V1846_01545 [Candidatus Komeilibacteria bacterium]